MHNDIRVRGSRPFFFTFKRLLMWAALPEGESA
jgi:hypothetical protein